MYLLHPGMNCTKATIIKHYYYPNIGDKIHAHIKVCKNCQKNEKQYKKYGYLTAKEPDVITWERL